MGAPVMWECDGVKYYADELKYMPVHYRYVNEYKTGCTLYVSGLDQRLKEFQAVEALTTCMGTMAAQELRRASIADPAQGSMGIAWWIRNLRWGIHPSSKQGIGECIHVSHEWCNIQ